MGIIYSVLPSFQQTEESNPIQPEEKIQSNPIQPEEKIQSNPIQPEEKIQSNPIQPEEKIQSNPIQTRKNTFESVEDPNIIDSFQKLIEIPNKKYKKIKYIHNT